MAGVNAGLLNIAAQLTIIYDGIAVLCMLGAGIFYMTARGNPRGQGQAFAWIVDIGKGLGIGLGATALVQMFLGNLKFG